MAAPAASPDPPESQHRIKVRILLAAAAILAFLAIFTSWIDRQLLDTDQWVDTSEELLEERVFSDAVADYSVDQLYANVGSEDRHPDDARLDRLARVGELKEKGMLTAAEFRAEKKRILADAARGEEAPLAPSNRRSR